MRQDNGSATIELVISLPILLLLSLLVFDFYQVHRIQLIAASVTNEIVKIGFLECPSSPDPQACLTSLANQYGDFITSAIGENQFILSLYNIGGVTVNHGFHAQVFAQGTQTDVLLLGKASFNSSTSPAIESQFEPTTLDLFPIKTLEVSNPVVCTIEFEKDYQFYMQKLIHLNTPLSIKSTMYY